MSDAESKSGDYSNQWRLCTVTQVEEFPLVIHLCCLEYDQQPYIDTRVLSTLFLTHIPLLVVTCNLLKAIKFGKNH